MRLGVSKSRIAAFMANTRVLLYFAVMTACFCSSMVGAAAIESSFPPNHAIDARAPSAGNAAELQGWQTIEIRFSEAVSGVGPNDFTLSEKGGDGVAPSITSVERIDSRTVLVILNEPLEPGTWIDLVHVSSRTGVSLGYLPGDVNGDGTVSPYADTLALIDCINIAGRCAPWQQDVDRNGQAQGESDRQMLFGLFRGTAESMAWAGVRMPQDVLAVLRAEWLAQRDPSPGTPRGTDDIHIRLDMTDLGPTEFGSVGVFDPAAFTPMLGVPVNPNDQLLLHIWARNNTASDILLRGLQFDPRASGFPYSLFGIDIDTVNQPLDGVPNLWFDYSELDDEGEELGLFPAAGSPSTGTYADFSNTLQGQPLIEFPQATVFAAQSGGPSVQIPMPPSQWVHLGAMPITVPAGTNSYSIDLLNVPNGDLNFGARIDFGFGVEPGDPITLFSSAPGGDGTIAYAPSTECGGLIQYDGALQQFQVPSAECCGNGVVQPGETCDDGGESATCDADCTIAECGDGTLNATAGEACDDGNTAPGDGCDGTCLLELGPFGACCLGTACSAVGESVCLDSGGTFFGLDTTCDAPDADGDGLRDECDGCPNDSKKLEPGICGCGVDDTVDSDGDGVPDCIDPSSGVPVFKLWVTEVYEVNPDGSYTPKCGANCPTQDLPPGLALVRDLINIEVTVEGWDDSPDSGICDSGGEICSVSAQDCAESHCTGSVTHVECTLDSNCVPPDTCDPDTCEKSPLVGTYKFVMDSSTYSNGGPSPGLALAQLACETNSDCACAYTEIPGSFNDCFDFQQINPPSCTCTGPQAACDGGVCGGGAAAYIDSSSIPNFLFFGNNFFSSIGLATDNTEVDAFVVDANPGGVPQDLFRCTTGNQTCNVDADCAAGSSCVLVAEPEYYLGTILLEVTGDSCELFTIDLIQDLITNVPIATFLNDQNAERLPAPIVETLTIDLGASLPCNDGDPCTENDVFCAGECAGTPIDCDPGACCLGAACSIATESDCLSSGGTFFGINTTCDAPDADGDGLRNDCDGCPADANKIEPGICGCGVDDTADSDDDGVPDCDDLCPGVDDAVFGDCTGTIPTVSVWGLLILGLLLLAGSKVVFRERLRRCRLP